MAENDPRPGILTLPDLNGKINTGEIETVLAVVPDPAGRLLGYHFPALYFLEQVARAGLTISAGTFAPQAPALTARPDLDTLRPAPWLEKSALVFCTPTQEDRPFAPAPRTLLQQQLDRARESGFRVRLAIDLQFTIFQEPYPALAGRGFFRPVPLGRAGQPADTLAADMAEPLLTALRRQLTAAGAPVAHTLREQAPGHYRLSFYPSEALVALDSVMLARAALPALARQMGLSATFMAQPVTDAPGNTMTLALSLWDPAGRQNQFAGEENATLAHFLAGALTHCPEWLLFFTPTVNSYKRLRLVGMNIWPGKDPQLSAGLHQGGDPTTPTVWTTLPGADANPYLAGAALLAAGLSGLEAGQQPPEEVAALPFSLFAATRRMQASASGRELFGAETLDFYTALAQRECTAFNHAVTDWERERYFLL